MSDTIAFSKRFQGGWLLSPGYDLTLIFGVLVLALGSGITVALRPEWFVYVLLTDLWLLGYHHVISTFTKLAGTKEDRQENRFLIYYLPFIVLGATVAIGMTVGIWAIITIYFFWQWYHYVRQSYGIAVFYIRKQEKPAPDLQEEKWLNNLVIWSVPIWGVLYRCSQGWEEFLFQKVWLPPVPLLVVQLAGTIALASTLAWIITRIIAWSQNRLSLAHTFFVASHICAFYVGYIAIEHINIGWLTANIWHNAQYVLFVWLYNTNRFKNPSAETKGVWIAWLSQRNWKRIIAYFTFCLVATSAFYGALIYGFKTFVANKEVLLMLYVLAFQTLNFHHYVVDSLIWKARHKKNRAIMDVKGA
jgi:hypothetical protein